MKIFGKERQTECILLTENESEKLYRELEVTIRPVLEKFGEAEWGKFSSFVTFKPPDPSAFLSDQGWIVQEVGGNSHYHIEIRSLMNTKSGEMKTGFLIRTGGASVFSDGMSKQELTKALEVAIKEGPNHLPPPWRK